MPATWADRKEAVAEKYRRDRAEFIDELGGVCVECGGTDRLEFDHTRRRDWEPRKHNRWTRLRKYRADHAAGRTIVLRCRWCNASKGKPDETEPSGVCGFCGSDVPESGFCTCA